MQRWRLWRLERKQGPHTLDLSRWGQPAPEREEVIVALLVVVSVLGILWALARFHGAR